MNVQKLVRYEAPKYPTEEQLSEDPTLLRKHLPPAWSKLLGAGTAGALLLGSLGGCETKAKPAPSPPIAVPTDHSAKARATMPAQASGPQSALVGLFEHGTGRGVTGCVAVSPPAFLSEEEGLQVVKEELAKVGISFDKRNLKLNDVKIYPAGTMSVSMELERTADGLQPHDVVRAEAVTLDLHDSTHSVSVEFISRLEAEKFGWDEGNDRYIGDDPSAARYLLKSTVSHFDFAETARHLAVKLKKDAPAGIYGVFYDPAVDRYRRGVRTKAEATEDAKAMLRQQVRDFANWLKDLGVVK